MTNMIILDFFGFQGFEACFRGKAGKKHAHQRGHKDK